MFGTLVDFIETLKFVKSRRSISSTNSTAAVTSASTGLVNSRSRRCLGSEPELTPMRIGVPCSLAFATTSATLSGPADVAGVQPHAVRAGLDRLERQRVVEVDVGDHRDRRLRRRSSCSASTSCSRGTATRTMSAPASATRADLVHRGLEVRGLRLGHRLHGDGRAAADGHAADVDLPLGSHRPHDTNRTVAHDVYATAAGPVARPRGLAGGRSRARPPPRAVLRRTGADAGHAGRGHRLRRAGPAGARARPGRHRRRPRPAAGLPRPVRAGRRRERPALRRRRVRPGLLPRR